MQTTDLGHGRGWLDAQAAASIERIDAEIGHPLQITEAGRTRAQQLEHWNTYQRFGKPIALHPDGPPKGNGPSIHQAGEAVDSDEAQQFVDLMNRHGWKQTVYRNGKLIGPWHFEYDPANDQHLGEDIMSAAAELAIFPIRDYLGANGGLNTKTPDTVGARVKDIQLALTNALPVLLKQSGGTPKEIAAAVVAAIPDDIAQDIIDGLAERLTRK